MDDKTWPPIWPTCPQCGSRTFFVESTWRVASGAVHRRRICALCESWGFVSSEEQLSPANGKLVPEPQVLKYTDTTPKMQDRKGRRR